MPSATKKQEKFMRAAAHNPEFAKKVGIPQSVAKEFNDADERKRELRRAMAEQKRKEARRRKRS